MKLTKKEIELLIDTLDYYNKDDIGEATTQKELKELENLINKLVKMRKETN